MTYKITYAEVSVKLHLCFLVFFASSFPLPSSACSHAKLPLKYTLLNSLKRESHKMVKHTQTIRRPLDDELLECVWPFCEIGA